MESEKPHPFSQRAFNGIVLAIGLTIFLSDIFHGINPKEGYN